jgi:hypothetical protein
MLKKNILECGQMSWLSGRHQMDLAEHRFTIRSAHWCLTQFD